MEQKHISRTTNFTFKVIGPALHGG